MQNQFFYTRKELVSGTPENPEFKEYRDSFNINKVVRTVTMEDGRLLVLIDDIHERAQEVPDVDAKTNKMKGYKRIRNTFQSEIFLEPSDAIRFYSATSVI
jgi:soluble cytochrome b562